MWLGAPESRPRELSRLSTTLLKLAEQQELDLGKDICFFGSEDTFTERNLELMHHNYILHFDGEECHEDNINAIAKQVERYFGRKDANQYWVSMSMDAVDRTEGSQAEQAAGAADSRFAIDFPD